MLYGLSTVGLLVSLMSSRQADGVRGITAAVDEAAKHTGQEPEYAARRDRYNCEPANQLIRNTAVTGGHRCVAAFYPLPRCLFHRVGGFHWVRFTIAFMLLPIRSELEKIVYRMSEILLAAEIALGRLYRRVPQQELNLLQLPSAVMAQLGTGPPQVVGCDVFQDRSPTAGPLHVPHDIL